MTVMKKLTNKFAAPGKQYRAKPFWAWNGDLKPEELRRQIQVMKKMGLGGFFMHSRVGLETDYLSEKWFECIDACVDEAKKLDMEAWLYDEDRWPSGAAGGLVTQHPEFQHKYLNMEILDSAKGFKKAKDVLAIFTAKVDGDKASNVKQCGKTIKISAGEKLLVFRMKTSDKSSWYNDQTFLDTMNPKATEAFIKVTHEAYAERFGDDFGKTIPGVFGDEPHHGPYFFDIQHVGNKTGVPWTPALPKVFKKRYGYNILDKIVEVFLDVTDIDENGITPARYHFHDCTTHMFCENYAKPIFDWCEKNDMQYTGHILFEDTLAHQAQVVGSCIRYYEYMQAPGMDLLTQHWSVFDTARQVSSAANQFGRKWRLTETYGCTGWDFPLLGHKALGDWQLALGINLRCQHLSWYTMAGEAKRDYPASISFQSPWWEDYSAVEDYYARANLIMTQGREKRDLLVIHPNESAWMICKIGFMNPDGQYKKEVIEFDNKHKKLSHSLWANGIDFDYGDEEILSRLAKVSGGKIKVGKASYTTILLPEMLTIRSSTLELLRKFIASGGKVIFAGKAAEYVNAVASDEAKQLAAECKSATPASKAMVNELAQCKLISVTDENGDQIKTALYQLREDKDAMYIFVCNTAADYTQGKNGMEMANKIVVDRNKSYEKVKITGFAGCEGQPVELDASNGQINIANAKKQGNGWAIETTLPAIGSRLFVIPKKAEKNKLAPLPKLRTVAKRKLGSNSWNYQLTENNVLVLDRPKYKFNDGKMQNELEILRLDQKVRDELGINHRGGEMLQPWADKNKKAGKSLKLTMEYSFEIKNIPSGDIHFAIEKPELCKIFVNGTQIEITADSGWWVDPSLRRIPVNPAMLIEGKNVITVEIQYNNLHPGLEIAYLLGNFGVKLKGTAATLIRLPEKLSTGNITKQALPFYSGNVCYSATLTKPAGNRKVFICVGSFAGSAVKILVNGQAVGVIGWGNRDEVDITDKLSAGRNLVTIEVLGHRRNSHGPLHEVKHTPWVGPGSFLYNKDNWCEDYHLAKVGLLENPIVEIRD